MSFIHWDKSVLSFHLKEIIEDHKAGDQTALLGLGAILVGTVALPVATKFGRSILKGIIKTGLSLYEESKPTSDAVSLSKVKKTKRAILSSSTASVNNNGRVPKDLSTLR